MECLTHSDNKYGAGTLIIMHEDDKEITDLDLEEIARLIKDGNTSGILDSEGYRISWEIKMEKFAI